jgi:hypothetical protein
MFKDFIAGGIALNANLEQARVKFTNIFGDEEAANKFINFLKVTTTELGISTDAAISFSKSLLPDVKTQDEFERLLRIGAKTAEELGLGAEGMERVRFAIEEALTGSWESMREGLGIQGEIVKQMRANSEEIGVLPAVMEGLTQNLVRSGVALDEVSDTYAATGGRVESLLSDLQTVLAKPVFEVFADQMQFFEEFLVEHADTLTLVAQQIGEVLGEVLGFGVEQLRSFLEGLEPGALEEFFLKVQNTVEIAKLFINQLVGMVGAIGEFSVGLIEALKLVPGVSEVIEFLSGSLSNVDERLGTVGTAFRTLTIIIAGAKAGWEFLAASVRATVDGFVAAGEALIALADRDIKKFTQKVQEANQKWDTAFEEGTKAATESLLEFHEAMGETDKAIADNIAAAEARKAAVEEGMETEVDFANTLLGERNAAKELAEQLAELEEAQLAVNEAYADLDAEIAEKEFDKILKAARAANRETIQLARRAEDEARQRAQKIADITRKHQERVSEATADGDEEQQEIARSQAKARQQLEQDLANKRVSILTQYRRQVEEINRRFDQTARQAARTRDASAFLRAREERGIALAGAGRGRDEALTELEAQGQRQRDELKAQQEEEREQRKVANEEKLVELDAQLQKELDKFEESEERRLEQQKISDQRKNEDAALKRQEDAEDYERWLTERQAILQEKYAEEFEIIRAAEESGLLAIQEAEAAKQAAMEETAEVAVTTAQQIAQANSRVAGTTSSPAAAGFTGETPIGAFQRGGQIRVGGQGGPDSQLVRFLATPAETITITPPGMSPGGGVVNNNNVDQSLRVDQSLVDPAAMGAEARAIARNEITSAFSEALRRVKR